MYFILYISTDICLDLIRLYILFCALCLDNFVLCEHFFFPLSKKFSDSMLQVPGD